MHKSLSMAFLGALVALTMLPGAAAAQYQAIPNFTGIGAGFNFRQAINQRLSGAQSIAPQIVGLPFASLPGERDGLLLCARTARRPPHAAPAAPGRGRRARAAPGPARPARSSRISMPTATTLPQPPASSRFNQAIRNHASRWCPAAESRSATASRPPFTVIDEGANVSGNVNGAINVKAPPYLARGDGVTDDTAAIQTAVNAACAASGINKPEVFLPATPGGLYYHTTAPILINCSIKFEGAGWTQTWLRQNYYGPTIIAQQAEAGWKPPFTSSISLTWQASHSYAQYADILDSNGNVQVQEAPGCTSGSGSHPAWPNAQGSTVTDGSVTWTLVMIGTQLATGSGSALDAVSPEMWPGAGFGSNNATKELGNPGGPNDGALNGLSHFTVEFYFNAITQTGGTTYYMVGMEAGAPESSNLAALQIYIADGQGSCPHNCVAAILDIGGSRIALQPTTAGADAAPGITHHLAVTYDGSNARLFLDGVLLKTTGASGNWTVLPYESFMIADQGVQVYPGMQTTAPTPLAYYDSLRISNSARYTSTFTPPTAKFVSDNNTVFLLNFPTGTPTGTIEGYSGPAGNPSNKNVFIPVETSDGGADLNPLYIGNLSLSDNGIWATWMLNSTIENINMQGAGRTCINLANNDYQDTVRRVFCVVVPFPKTNVGFLFLNQSNNNLYDHLQCDGQYTCIEQATGSGHYIMPDFSDRGYAVYPLAFMQGQAVLDSPELDIEDTAANQLAAVYSNGGYAPVIINGGQLFSGSTGAAYLAINGGAPFIVAGTLFGGGSPAELLGDYNPY